MGGVVDALAPPKLLALHDSLAGKSQWRECGSDYITFPVRSSEAGFHCLSRPILYQARHETSKAGTAWNWGKVENWQKTAHATVHFKFENPILLLEFIDCAN